MADNEQNVSSDFTIDQLDGIAGDFPLRAIAGTRGYGQAAVFKVRDRADLQAAGRLYTEDHLEALRDHLICGYAIEAGSWLDLQAYDAWIADYTANGGEENLTMPERNESIEEKAANLAAEVIPTPVGRCYVETYDLTHTKEFMKKFSADAIEAHKEIVNDSEWLSDASKKRLCEKLDDITLNVVYPHVWEDYSDLDLDGLDYYETRKAIWLSDQARNAEKTGKEIDDRLWELPSLMSTGAYSFINNSFHRTAGAGSFEWSSHRLFVNPFIDGRLFRCMDQLNRKVSLVPLNNCNAKCIAFFARDVILILTTRY